MEFERKRHKHDFINIAPLVDVVFLLLLFFMLTSQLIQEPQIKIELPESKTSSVQDERTQTLVIAANGDIYFMDQKVEFGQMQSVLKVSLDDSSGDFLKIKADREVDVGLLVRVIDEVRLSGVKNFSIVTERG